MMVTRTRKAVTRWTYGSIVVCRGVQRLVRYTSILCSAFEQALTAAVCA
jgi:hypothetical protein